MSSRPVDYGPLTRPLTRVEVREFFRQHHNDAGLNANAISKWHRTGAIIVAGFFGLVIVLPWVMSFIVSVMSGDIDAAGPPIGAIIAILVVGGGVLWLIHLGTQKRKEQVMRLSEFAAKNKLAYTPIVEGSVHRTGLIFQQGGHSKKTQDILSGAGFEAANYTYVTGHGKNAHTHTWGYIAIPLERHVPHMLLDSKKNNLQLFGKDVVGSLPITFKKDQILSLEGDFNNHFTLYAPKEYERDALYIFTPDLMALLIDQTAEYDVEVVDDMLYVYSTTHFKFTDRPVMERIMAITQTVGSKAVDRTDYYADTRVGNRTIDAIAAHGQRLQKGVPVIAVIVMLFVFGYFFFTVFDMWQVFSR